MEKIKDFLDDVRYLAECDVLGGCDNNFNELALFNYLKDTWMNGEYGGETDDFDAIADEAIDAYTDAFTTVMEKYV